MRKRRSMLRTYEVMPATIQIPMLPRLGTGDLKAEALGTTPTPGWFSRKTTLAEAERNRRAAVDRCLDLCAAGDTRGLGELLVLAKEFGHDPRIADAMRDVILAARVGAKRTGRPRGLAPADHERSLRIARIVEGFRASNITLEQVLEAMDAQNFERVTARTRRNDYYRARNHPAVQPLFFRREDQRQLVRRRGAASAGWVFVPQQVRIELPYALPAGIPVSLRVTRQENTTHFAVRIG